MICPDCGGSGQYDLYDYHSDRVDTVNCHGCHGHGIERNEPVQRAKRVDAIAIAIVAIERFYAGNANQRKS